MSVESLKRFVLDGSYREMKNLESEMRAIKDHLEKALNERGVVVKRVEWKDVGMVAKYSKVNIYEWDREGLNSFLDNLGILPLVCTIAEKSLSRDFQAMVAPFISGVKQSIRYIPNSVGKRMLMDKEPDDPKALLHNDLKVNLIRWKECHRKYSLVSLEWKRRKAVAISFHNFDKQSAIQWEYGRFNLESKVHYSILDVFQKLGREFVVQNSQIRISAIDSFLAKGMIRKADIEPYRKLVDISMRFTIMETTSEEKSRQYLDRKLKMLTTNKGAH